MPKDLFLTIVQPRITWESPLDNFKLLNRQLSKTGRGETDLVVLPEMFSTGFSMRAKQHAEQMEGPTMQWMFETAQGLQAAVCGSVMIREEGKYYNRFIWMEADGHYDQYDKRHLFSIGKEDKTYTAGTEGIVIEYKGWGFCPQICYDLRFPVWSRNLTQRSGKAVKYDYDVLLYVANWPAIRSHHWSQLLIARAIENQCYVAGVNRVGDDGNAVAHSGQSVVLEPLGTPLSGLKPNQPGVATVALSWKALQELRKRFPVLRDADTFSIA